MTKQEILERIEDILNLLRHELEDSITEEDRFSKEKV